MSDLNSDWGGGNSSPVSGGTYEASIGKAPYHWLLIGFSLALLEVVLFIIFQPSAESALLANSLLWILNLGITLTPFALFVVQDISIKSKSTHYSSNPDTVKIIRLVYLGFSLLVSSYFIYGVADELSRILNVVN